MKLKKISERIYYLPSDSETDRPVLGYIRGDRYSLMVDAGNSSNHVDIFNRELTEQGLPLPDYVAITHWHWDHTFGMSAVTGLTIANKSTNEQLKIVKDWSWSDEAMARRLQTGDDIEFCDRCIRLEYTDRSNIDVRTADIEYDRSLGLDLGGVHCILSRITAPHSDDSTVIYIPEEKVLFIGDADCEDFYHNNGKYDKNKLEELIDYLSPLDFTTYVLGHDEPQTKDEVMEYLNDELGKLS